MDNYSARINCEIVPEERKFLLSNGSNIVELDKALYGCLQSGKLWYENLKDLLYSIGFRCNHYSKCVFIKQNGSAISAWLLVYVDDLMLII